MEVDIGDGIAELAANVAVEVNSESSTWQATMKSDRDIARVVENLAKVRRRMCMEY